MHNLMREAVLRYGDLISDTPANGTVEHRTALSDTHARIGNARTVGSYAVCGNLN